MRCGGGFDDAVNRFGRSVGGAAGADEGCNMKEDQGAVMSGSHRL